MCGFTVKPEWAERLKASALDSLESLMSFKEGDCVSIHKRGATFRTRLADGTVVYIKRDHFTFLKEILKDVLRFRSPAQKTVKERRAFEAAKAAGFMVPEVIAYGCSSRFGLPHQAAMVMLELPGTNLDAYVKEGHDDCQEMIAKAEKTLASLQANGFDWPDHKPEHFIVQPDGGIALIDLERMNQGKAPLSPAKSELQLRRFRSLLPNIKKD